MGWFRSVLLGRDPELELEAKNRNEESEWYTVSAAPAVSRQCGTERTLGHLRDRQGHLFVLAASPYPEASPGW